MPLDVGEGMGPPVHVAGPQVEWKKPRFWRLGLSWILSKGGFEDDETLDQPRES